MLMSATSSEDVDRLTKLVLHNPLTLNLLGAATSGEQVLVGFDVLPLLAPPFVVLGKVLAMNLPVPSQLWGAGAGAPAPGVCYIVPGAAAGRLPLATADQTHTALFTVPSLTGWRSGGSGSRRRGR